MLGIASEDGWHEFENLFSSPSSSSPRNLVSAPESEQSPLKVNLTKARSQQSNWEHPHTHQQQVNPRFYWSLKSLHPDPLLIHRFWFLILTPMFEITYVRAGGEDGSVFDKMFQCFHSVRLIWFDFDSCFHSVRLQYPRLKSPLWGRETAAEAAPGYLAVDIVEAGHLSGSTIIWSRDWQLGRQLASLERLEKVSCGIGGTGHFICVTQDLYSALTLWETVIT